MEKEKIRPNKYWRAFEFDDLTPRCLDEVLIMDISCQIRSKPDWKRKYKNFDLFAKWKAEVAQSPNIKTRHLKQIFDFVLEELTWYEKCERSLGNWQIGYDDKVVLSDDCVVEGTRQNLLREAQALKDSFSAIDYHPRSDEMVIDLVHPSLYPIVYDKTKTTAGKVLVERRYCGLRQEFTYVYPKPRKFLWLPAVLKKKDGKFRFLSYINNLHPIEFENLYSTIEDVLNDALLGLNWCISRLLSAEYVRMEVSPETAYSEAFFEEQNKLFGEWSERGDIDFDARLEALRKRHLTEFVPKYLDDPETFHVDLRQWDQFQVIVKMADIELTPEKPRYPGGAWHIEATDEEDIVATVLYYYDVENITTSQLSFRTSFTDPEYEQGDDFYVKTIYGFKDEDPMVRPLGAVESKQGRVVIFPNLLQHHVDAFELADKTKPGHRKILCFFVINPFNTQVVGSDKVAPQQESWWEDGAAKKYFPQLGKEDASLMSWDEALAVREQLMDERLAKIGHDNESFERFSLCEH